MSNLDLNAALAECRELFNRQRAYENDWLNVTQLAFGERYSDRGRRRLPADLPALRAAAFTLLGAFKNRWAVDPTVLYVQIARNGGVKRHRDPKTDLVGTSILWLGDFDGGDLVHLDGGQEIHQQAAPGRIAHLPCTQNGVQGPVHWTTPHRGERWSLVLNRSVK